MTTNPMMTTDKPSADTVLTTRGGISFLTFPGLGDPTQLTHGISTRAGGVSRGKLGSLNLSFKTGDDTLRVKENRLLFMKTLGISVINPATLNQVHGDGIRRVMKGERLPLDGILGEGDALLTDVPGIPLMILVADCLPILLFDPVHRAVGLAHAGWRGTVNHVGAKTLLRMGEEFGTHPPDVKVALGPAIGSCCYEVGKEVTEPFQSVFPWAGEVLSPGTGPDKFKLNLEESNARQMLEIGVSHEHVLRSGLCTIRRNDLFYSHRAEASDERPTGRFGALIMLAS
jgi:polyphenol oxidase